LGGEFSGQRLEIAAKGFDFGGRQLARFFHGRTG
jgi:hypothetical protein